MLRIMQRITAWTTLTAFLLVITLPLMPITPVYAHDKVETCTKQDTCGGDCHGGDCHSEQSTPNDLVMTDMDMAMPEVSSSNAISQAEVAPTRSAPNIECGCGCNGTPDVFPMVLSPHIPSYVNIQNSIVSTRSTQDVVSVKIIRNTPPSIPPPRII
jgi:hypothetical protein